MRIIKKLIKIAVALFLLGMLTVALTYAYVRKDLPSVEILKDVQLQTPMKIYTADGLLISQYGEKRRIPLALHQIPKLMTQAFIATEDSRFYDHPGIDIIGIVRSLVAVATTGQLTQGASTITMQVARNFFLSREKTLIRKVKELFIALRIESELSKDDILTLYLNKIPLGHRSFGVGAAAQVYYGKDVQQLTLAEIATIAGLPKAPSNLNPISNPERAKSRRSVVLYRMLSMNFITQAQYEQAKEAPITASRHGVDIEASAPYVAAIVNLEMINRYGMEQAYTGGYNVYTTVPSQLQLAAQQAVMNNLHNYDKRHGYRGPVKYLWQQNGVRTESSIDYDTQNSNAGSDLFQETDTDIEPAEELDPDEPAIGEAIDPLRFGTASVDAWPISQVDEYLATVTNVGQVSAAVVMAYTDNTAVVRTANQQTLVLTWDQLKWARPYINDLKVGKKPKLVADIFKDGAQIWLRLNDKGILELAQLPGPSSALVALNPTNGAIRSIVGGYSFELSQYNRAVQAKRQVGSNIKPLIYSAALANGHTLATLVNDAPIHQWDKQLGVAWRPQNSPPRYDGPIRIRVALAKSKNVVSVRLLKSVGLNNIVEHIEKFGISRSEIPENDSLALGSASLTPLQVATSIAAFANGGFVIEPYIIDRIVANGSETIYQANPVMACDDCEVELAAAEPDPYGVNAGGYSGPDALSSPSQQQLQQSHQSAPRAVSAQNAFLVRQAMTSTIWGGGDWAHKTGWNGTGWAAQKLKRRDLSGKTGTTNDAKDTWFSGFNSKLMVTTWVGFDNPSRTLGRVSAGGEAGARTALPAWIEYMKIALNGVEQDNIELPTDIVSVRIDQQTGLLATQFDHTSRFEYFIRGTEPVEYATADNTPMIYDNDGEGKVSEDNELF